MKKLTMFACFALAVVFALFSFAGELPQMTLGNSIIHGGSVHFNKAELDTINLMAASNDPTNNSDPRDGGLEPYYDGDFEDANGDPAWNGWTHYDVTQPTVSHWNVSTYNQPNPANHAAWCGDINFDACDTNDVAGGYGNGWHDLIEFRQTVPNPDISSTVTVTATLMHDCEPEYDYTYLSYRYRGQRLGDIQSWDGTGTVAVEGSVTYLPQEYMDGTDIAVYFRFKSDGGWSDEGCRWPTAGACQVDDINVNIVNGAFDADFFEDFEHGGDPDDFGIWNLGIPDGVGDFSRIWTGLVDADPCRTNSTPQVAFIDDGVVVPGTGGSDCINWCYGPGGYIVNTTGGLIAGSEYIHNVIESPVMAWPHPKDGGGGPDYDGIFLSFEVYVHEDLSSDSPGIFWIWNVRSADTDGSAGNGVQIITDQGWRNYNTVGYGGPNYKSPSGDITELMNPGRDEVQVALSVAELGWIWGWIGNDGYPAPFFDNVTVKIFPYLGPGMSSRTIDIAQDNFPDRGSIDMGDPGSHSVRFDAAKNISRALELRNDPGDSIIFTLVPVRAGAEFDGDPELHYLLDANPVFDPYRTAGLPDMGTVPGMKAIRGNEPWTPGKWAFDLPDTGFLFPGDVLHYFISATDAIGGGGGSDPQTALLPADTTGFSTGFGNPLNYDPRFVVRALPSIRDNGFGGYEQPGILFINDFADYGGENEWHSALNNIGLLVGEDYDVYFVNGPDSDVGNGIGGRASHILLTDYDDILYTSGAMGIFTLANGDFNNDAGNDVATLTGWLDQGGKDIFLTGDGLASDLAQSGSEGQAFLEGYMGVSTVTHDVRPLIGNQTTPLVRVTAGNPVFNGSLQTWIAFGGCYDVNSFDGVNVLGTALRIAEFDNPTGGQYSYSAAALNLLAGGSRVISMPVDLMYVYTDPAAAGNLRPGRAQLLRDVLLYFGVAGDPQDVSPVLPGITFQTNHYPNPFNPSTTIKYSMPTAGHLKLCIYNVRGQLVKTMIDGNRPAGADQTIVWDGTDNQGGSVSSGIYFYEARTGGEVKVQKMALVK